MPQVYSVEEANRLYKEIKDLLQKGTTEQMVSIADIKAKVDEKFNELFSLYHTCNNKLNKLDQDLKQEQKVKSMKVRSPYAH
jgi:hypothetical protein